MGGMERIKGERIELQSDGAEKHDQRMLTLGRFDVEEMRSFFKHVLGDLQNCVSCAGGEDIFRKILKKSGRKVKNGAERP